MLQVNSGDYERVAQRFSGFWKKKIVQRKQRNLALICNAVKERKINVIYFIRHILCTWHNHLCMLSIQNCASSMRRNINRKTKERDIHGLCRSEAIRTDSSTFAFNLSHKMRRYSSDRLMQVPQVHSPPF